MAKKPNNNGSHMQDSTAEAPDRAAHRDLREKGYESEEYKKAKDGYLRIVGPTAFLEAFDKYASSISLGIFGIAISNMFNAAKRGEGAQPLKDPTTIGLALTALATALLGVYAHFKKAVIAEPKKIAHREAIAEVTAGLEGEAIGEAISKNMTPHLKELYERQKQPDKNWSKKTAKKEEVETAELAM